MSRYNIRNMKFKELYIAFSATTYWESPVVAFSKLRRSGLKTSIQVSGPAALLMRRWIKITKRKVYRTLSEYTTSHHN